MTIVKRLISEYKIGVMPGSTFGIADSCSLRISYGPLRSHTVDEAMNRLVIGLKGIVKS
jgi:aspartate/methionine/tyrosine aminotransferase